MNDNSALGESDMHLALELTANGLVHIRFNAIHQHLMTTVIWTGGLDELKNVLNNSPQGGIYELPDCIVDAAGVPTITIHPATIRLTDETVVELESWTEEQLAVMHVG